MRSYAYGFPRLGKNREFKKLIESYWKGSIMENQLVKGIENLDSNRNETYKKYVDSFPQGEMSLYDPMLDMALLFGVYRADNLNEYFNLCRGKNALEMTKWFNTNYHYLVPDFEGKPLSFSITKSPWDIHKNVNENAYLIGPFTFLKLSKNIPPENFPHALKELTGKYLEYINLHSFASVHLDDPALVMELDKTEWEIIERVYQEFEKAKAEIYLFTYYDSIDYLDLLLELPFSGVGVDLIHDRGENLKKLEKKGFTSKVLFAGIVDGRNVWRTDLFKAAEIIKRLDEKFQKVIITNAAPLYHLPVSLEKVTLPEELKRKISFAEERLYEIKLIGEILNGNKEKAVEWLPNTDKTFGYIPAVKERVAHLKDEDFIRKPLYSERKKIHQKIFNFPLFPTTTIGSFPQTEDVRRLRALYKQGKLDKESYELFIRGEISKTIKIQEELGIDVLVHGEFERSDMVEFFAEKMKGIATTDNGWIISYGTRCYRPPIIYGDVEREDQMTVKEISYAQSLTNNFVKGMITGPVTILSWSYVREDLPIDKVAYQIALTLKDEITDYEKNGIKIIQIDEPAFREKVPIKKRNWDKYFNWAIKAFRLAHSSANPETQIHTHMCYSEFSEIIEYILQLDFDVISIEASRSKGNIIESFEKANFDRQVGLGVWDIHSPHVPTAEEMKKIVKRALKVIPTENFWINPDCGLKTRNWEEVIPSLKNMLSLAKELRSM